MNRTADAPIKANNSFLLSLGMVNIPLSVLTGTTTTRVVRTEFVVGDTARPVGRMAYDKSSGKPVEQFDIVRMALASDGSWVALSDDEIEQATLPKGVAEVIAFVPASKVTQTYTTEKVDQVRAKTSGLNKAQKAAAERAFGLFLAGLKARKVSALIKVALRGPARYAAITAEGDMLLLYPDDAIRQPKPLAPVILTDRELDLMGQLIDSYPKGTPAIADDTATAVQTYVDIKAQSKGVRPAQVNLDNAGPADDLLAALTQSIGQKVAV